MMNLRRIDELNYLRRIKYMKNFKRILLVGLVLCMVLGLTACGGEEVVEPEPTEAAPVQQGYTYGMAGDLFRKYVNAVSSDNFDEVMTYLNVGENDIVTKEDVKMFLMTQKIGNLIGEPYSTSDIVVSEEGSIRGVTFYYLTSRLTKPDSFDGRVILVGTDWKVYLPELYTNKGTLALPKGEYTSIEIGGVKLDVNAFEIEGDYQVYKLPYVSYYAKDVSVKRADGAEWSGQFSWTYNVEKNGKVSDDARRTVNAGDFTYPQQGAQSTPVEGTDDTQLVS